MDDPTVDTSQVTRKRPSRFNISTAQGQPECKEAKGMNESISAASRGKRKKNNHYNYKKNYDHSDNINTNQMGKNMENRKQKNE